MAITAAQPGWHAVFWFRFEDREEYTTEVVIGWSLKPNGDIEPVSMVATGKCSLPTPTGADRRRSSDSLSERYLGCLEDVSPWPFECEDPRDVTPDVKGTRRVGVERVRDPSMDSFELEE